jgi:hypothetical protein
MQQTTVGLPLTASSACKYPRDWREGNRVYVTLETGMRDSSSMP